MEKWKGKVAVVTGASSGIGSAIVDRLLLEGLMVVGLARNLTGNRHPQFYGITTDVTKESDILNAFANIQHRFGPIHILVNNSGIIRKSGIIDGTTAEWQSTFDTNVLALCIATREAIKSMQKGPVSGHIINISSKAGHVVPNFPDLNVYPASKAAVLALSETLRHELKAIESKIKVTTISPTTVNTPMAVTGGFTTSEEMSAISSIILQPSDVANAVVYALSAESNVEISEIVMRSVDSPF